MSKSTYYAVVGCNYKQTTKLLNRGASVGEDMEGNPLVVTPKHTPSAIRAQVTLVTTLRGQSKGNHAKTLLFHTESKNLHTMLMENAVQINSLGPFTKEQIDSLGYASTKDPEAQGTPADVSIKSSKSVTPEYSRKFTLARPLQQKKQYDIRIGLYTGDTSALPADLRDNVETSTTWDNELGKTGVSSNKLIVSGLTEDRKYVVQIRATTTNYKGKWSDPHFFTAV